MQIRLLSEEEQIEIREVTINIDFKRLIKERQSNIYGNRKFLEGMGRLLDSNDLLSDF